MSWMLLIWTERGTNTRRSTEQRLPPDRLQHLAIRVLPQRPRLCPLGRRGRLVATVFGEERERAVRAGVVRVVLAHLTRRPRRELPVADLSRRAGHGFDGEKRLRPRIGTWREPELLHRLLQERPAFLLLARAQEELPLQQ